MFFAYKRSLKINRAYKYKATPTPLRRVEDNWEAFRVGDKATLRGW